ncbi:MAG: hypothetical protein JSW44_04500 [Candidatus Bathyarchaeota archaeon]|nr:MAG: hypothetical protein JSW44_04500 [Candidatus Bathyarchaeota archaeon]
MFKNFKDKIAISGITVLCIGVTLLIITFVSAYGFLTESIVPISTQDLVQTFGEALGPLIAAAIHIMYLGVMGWIGSLITIRGVSIMTNAPKAEKIKQPPQTLQTTQRKKYPQPRKAKAKLEAKPAEPELVVIPLEEMEQKQPTKRGSKPTH